MRRIIDIKRVLALVVIALIGVVANANEKTKVTTIKPQKRGATSFAIFVDAKTFNECREEIMAYKNVLESEKLGTYVIYANWRTPEEVKEELAKIAKSRRTPLEGVVFIGDIPIVRVRGGQHLTTAFKMDEKVYPKERSSVSSDRYYDCPDLDFEFICKDSLKSNQFYYRLTEKGAQKLEPKYYSARIIVPSQLTKTTGKDKYSYISEYLTKVVAAHKESNVMDNFIHFSGHGYNSDCLTVWRHREKLFSNHFPNNFVNSDGNMFLNFRQDDKMKFKLFPVMERSGTDIFFFYEHGGVEVQYINGQPNPSVVDDNLKMFMLNLRTEMRRYKGEERTKKVAEIAKSYDLNPNDFTDKILDETAKEDKELGRSFNIYLEDLVKLKTSPRFTMFNACYNGSFHEDGYVAGYHIFNDGNTVVTQGNSINVLQDKWGDELVGLLALGVRVGMWQNEVTTLESHLIGDPTYRFAIHDNDKNDRDIVALNSALASPSDNIALWNRLSKHKLPTLRAVAIKQQLKVTNNKSVLSDSLYSIFCNDKSVVVRLQALEALAEIRDDNFVKAIAKGLSDPIEPICRRSANYSGKVGDKQFIPLLESLIENNSEMVRLAYAAPSAMRCFNNYDKLDIFNMGLTTALRGLRNTPRLAILDTLFELLRDANVDEYNKMVLCEALGWYNFSIKRKEIASRLERELTDNNTLTPAVRGEIVKAIKRLY